MLIARLPALYQISRLLLCPPVQIFHAHHRYTRESKALMKISSYGTAHSQQQADAIAGGLPSPDTQGKQAEHATAAL